MLLQQDSWAQQEEGFIIRTAQTSGVANNIGCISIGESLIYHVGTGDITKSIF